jgi:hypothetical protein
MPLALNSLTAVLVVAVAAGAAPVPPPPPGAPPSTDQARSPEALALLRRMCDRIQQARTFTFQGRTALELPVAGGALGTFFNDASVAVRRPDGFAGSRSGDLPEFRFAYDGKSMTAFAPGLGRWGTTAAPPTLDAMLVAADAQGGINLPFDELLVADPYAALTAGLTGAVLAGQASAGGRRVEHLVLSSPRLQVELWVDPVTALPARELVIYVDHPLRPHFLVEYSEWRLDPTLPASTFALPRPAGAAQVEFGVAASAFR